MTVVLSIAYPFAPVGADAVGGAEQVLSAIDRALVAAGHRSIVVARADSHVAGELLGVPASAGTMDGAAMETVHAAVRDRIAGAVDRADVIHLHGVDFDRYLPQAGKPMLATLHLPPDWYRREALRPGRPRTWLNCVSHSQHRACPAGLRLLEPVPNGVPVQSLAQARHARRGYVLMLGRICPEKGQHLGLLAAREAGTAALIAGEVFPYPSHRAYFDRAVRPLLDGRRRFLGPIGFRRKRRLLAAARCLLVPSLAAETSSLVTMEALACGTPVVAFRSGALPELIEQGRTGFLVRDETEMAAAIARAGRIDPDACRRAAAARFSAEGMTRAYIDLYGRLPCM